MRSPVAVIVAVAMIASTFAPATAADLPTASSADALRLLQSKCTIAQATPASPAPDASASPSAGPTQPPPSAPYQGPAQLVIPPLPTSSPQYTPPPLPTPTPSVRTTSGPIYIQRQTPAPSPAASGVPTPIPTLTPHPAQTLGAGQYIVLSNTATGGTNPGDPADLDGNVNIFFQDGLLVGDHAHYDGIQYFDITGHPYIRNREDDSIIYADSIRYDTYNSRAILVNGRGATTQGVDRGKFHFSAKTLRTEGSGVMHGDRATFSTCENPRGGYHVESKTLDVMPGDKAIGHNNVLYLGALAVLYLPLIVIPLTENQPGTRRDTGFVPLIGYSQSQGFYVLAKIGFGQTDYYYGYYRVEEYTRVGTGLGYVAFFRRKDGKRSVDVNAYHFQTKNADLQPTGTNLTVNDAEIWSKTVRANFNVNYTGSYAPGITLANSLALSGSISHQTAKDSQSYTFNRQTTGSDESSLNLGFTDQRTLSPVLTQGINLSLTDNQNAYAGVVDSVQSIHINTVTDLRGPGEDYDLTYDRTDSPTPIGIDKEPELLIRPRGNLFPNFQLIPITGSFAIGNYSEEQSVTNSADLSSSSYQVFTTQRGQAALTFGPEVAHFLGSDFNASVIATQDAYATGDLKAEIQQNASFTTPLGDHVINAITYSEQNVNGPEAEPFQSFDILSGNSSQASDLIRIFNGSAYNLTLSSDTIFKREAQPVSYQLAFMPTIKTAVMIGGSWVPGPGNGFSTTNVQISTPVGYESDIQFATNVDWKSRGRLESKNIYYRKVIGECYEVDVAYNQDLRQVTLAVQLLAFPTQRLNFGLAQSGSIVPGSLNFSSVAGALGAGSAPGIGP
jgi:hypothetical protein